MSATKKKPTRIDRERGVANRIDREREVAKRNSRSDSDRADRLRSHAKALALLMQDLADDADDFSLELVVRAQEEADARRERRT
jgi:hypothetical protein